MTRSDLIAWAEVHGWTRNRWGHWRKAEYRLRVSSGAARIETKSAGGWVRLRSGYLRDIHVAKDFAGEKLVGMTPYGCYGLRGPKGGTE